MPTNENANSLKKTRHFEEKIKVTHTTVFERVVELCYKRGTFSSSFHNELSPPSDLFIQRITTIESSLIDNCEITHRTRLINKTWTNTTEVYHPHLAQDTKLCNTVSRLLANKNSQ